MELATTTIEAATFKSGQAAGISVPAGQSLKIETGPEGEEILNEECPAGKAWSARIIVEITETDA